MKSYVKAFKRFASAMLSLFMLVGMLCENYSVVYASQTLSWIVKPKYNYDDVQPLVDIYRQESVDNDLGNFEARVLYYVDGKAGLSDYYGNNIIDYSLEAEWWKDSRAGTGIFAKGGSYNVNGCIGNYIGGGGGVPVYYWNESTQSVISPNWDGGWDEATYFSPKKICVLESVSYNSQEMKHNGTYRLVGSNKKLVSSKQFEEIKSNVIYTQYYIVGDYAVVKENGKWGYMKSNGTYLLKPQYEDAYPFVNGIAAVKKNGKAGFVREDGSTITDFVFEETRSIYEGKAWVKYNGKWGVLNIAKMAGLKVENSYTAEKMQEAALEAIEYFDSDESKRSLVPYTISFMDYDMDGKLELFISEWSVSGLLSGIILKYENGHYYTWSNFSFSGNEEKFNVIYVNEKNEYIFLQEFLNRVYSELYTSVFIYDVKNRTEKELVTNCLNYNNNECKYYENNKEITKDKYDQIIANALKGYVKIDSTFKFVNLINGNYIENIKEAWNAYSIKNNVRVSSGILQVKELCQTKPYSTTSITMKWNKCKNATGYEIYRATSKKGTYKKVKTTKATSYKQGKLTRGKTYYYKVRAYKVVNGKKKYGKFSSVKAMGTKPQTPSIKVYAGNKKAKVVWKKISGISGYETYMSTSKKGTYSKIKTSGSKNTAYLKTGLTKGKTYSFKVRSYRTVGRKKIYSTWSQVKSIKVK